MSGSGSNVRLAVACLLLAAIAAAGFRTSLPRAFLSAPPADPLPPQQRAFLERVALTTPRGSRIAVVLLPRRSWDDGYAYPFFRAQYALAGRTVLRAMGEDAAAVDRAAARGEFVASWPPHAIAGFTAQWEGEGGALARRWK